MPPTNAVFHALLRPAVIQILRASGFHSSRPAVIDSLTDLATRYLELLCQETARSAAESADGNTILGSTQATIVDVRVALQSVGAFLPERDWEEQDFIEEEDTRGLDEFLSWSMGPKPEQIKRVALDEPEEGVPDYLTGTFTMVLLARRKGGEFFSRFAQFTNVNPMAALKKKHSKTADDSKFTGTLLGKAHDQGLVTVEGDSEIDSIQAWANKRRTPLASPPVEDDSRPASSGLSSVATMADEMDLGGA